jgi:hypothetical protein
VESSCIEFEGYRNKKGYGVKRRGQKTYLAHRLVFADYRHYDIAALDGWAVLHSCDNPPCINPEHLSLGTNGDNTRDSVAKGRHRKLNGSQVGTSLLTEEQVLAIRKWCDEGGTQAAMALKYGVSKQAISAIHNRVSWTHI